MANLSSGRKEDPKQVVGEELIEKNNQDLKFTEGHIKTD